MEQLLGFEAPSPGMELESSVRDDREGGRTTRQRRSLTSACGKWAPPYVFRCVLTALSNDSTMSGSLELGRSAM